MGAITPTLSKRTTLAKPSLHTINVTPASASDTIDVSSIVGTIEEIVSARLTAGYDALLAGAFATFSGTTITLVTTAAAGTAATDWTGAAAKITFTGY